MEQVVVSVRELKSRLSHYLQMVMHGNILLVTSRGKPVGRLIPVSATVNDEIARLIDAGVIAWEGGKPGIQSPPVALRTGQSVAEILVEDRR